MNNTWERMTLLGRQEAMFQRWLFPQGVTFESEAAAESYRARIGRLKDAVQLKNPPDRVPVFSLATFMPADLAGVTPKEAMYEPEKLVAAWKSYVHDYDPDFYGGPGDVGCGQMLDILDFKAYQWPGRGVGETSCYQALEDQYMREEDYEALVADPTDFWLRGYLPRIFGALASLKDIHPLTNLCELPGLAVNLAPLGTPRAGEALQALMDAGQTAYEWLQHLIAFEEDARRKGKVMLFKAMAKAPYDYLADTLRSTRHTIFDIYRRPEKVVAAMETLSPLIIKAGIAGPKASGNPLVFMPLHKGADGFMSDDHFKTFYWPYLKQVILGLINEGCVPLLFAEGGYNSRLEYLNELPKGHCIWLFDRTDIFRAKEVVGETTCIAGNIPAGTILTGGQDEVKKTCKKLINFVGKGGGYMLCPGTAMDQGKPETIHAMIDFTKKYGRYG